MCVLKIQVFSDCFLARNRVRRCVKKHRTDPEVCPFVLRESNAQVDQTPLGCRFEDAYGANHA